MVKVFKGNFHLPEKKEHLYEIAKSALLLAKRTIIAHIIREEAFIWIWAVSAVQYNTLFFTLFRLIYEGKENGRILKTLSYILYCINLLYHLASIHLCTKHEILRIF